MLYITKTVASVRDWCPYLNRFEVHDGLRELFEKEVGRRQRLSTEDGVWRDREKK